MFGSLSSVRNTIPNLSILFSTAPPDLRRMGRRCLGFLRPILAFSALTIAALSAFGQNITSTASTNNEAVAIDVISTQNTICTCDKTANQEIGVPRRGA